MKLQSGEIRLCTAGPSEMGRIPQRKIRMLFRDADNALSKYIRGARLESAMRLLLEAVPGIELADRNTKNTANTEEIDLTFWNERRQAGLYFLDTPFLTECKNWRAKVSGQEIVYFANTMRGRGCKDGILVAANGITGSPGELTEAYYEIAVALRSGQRILVLTRSEIENLTTTAALVLLLKQKILDVTLKGTKVR